MTLRLHWSPDSANIVVRMALEELGLPFSGVRLNRAAGELKRPAYLALNPQGLLPVLEDGNLVLFETGAILLHLADRSGRLGPKGPGAPEPTARAAFLNGCSISRTPSIPTCASLSTRRAISPTRRQSRRSGLGWRRGCASIWA